MLLSKPWQTATKERSILQQLILKPQVAQLQMSLKTN